MNTNFLPSGYFLHQRYSIQQSLGQGGFGMTYLAYDTMLDQEVCIKELFIAGNSTRGTNLTVLSESIQGFSFEDFVNRFMEEARKLAQFRHPNIVRVLEWFQANATAYMVMDYVKGETLKQKVQKEGALSEHVAMKLIDQLLNGVEEVHKKGMLHRDIKPDNILITDEGKLALIDFGSAREFSDGKTITHTAMLTPGYAPMEQYSDKAQRGPFTDIYSIGATIYFMITGEKPLTVTDRNLEELSPPHSKNASISSQVSSAVMLAMEMKPENRFQHISEMRVALKSLKVSQEPKKKEIGGSKKESLEIIEARSENSSHWIYGILVFFVIGLGSLVYFSKERSGVDPVLTEKEELPKVKEVENVLEDQREQNSQSEIITIPQVIQKLQADMVYVLGGTFTMGCTSEQGTDCYDDEKPVHQVSVNSFYMNEYEVTQAQWSKVMGYNPSYFIGCDQCPVEQVSWSDVQEFIRKLNNITGKNYRLPTEAEWEYAARGGKYSLGFKYSGSDNPKDVAWFSETVNRGTFPVGKKEPNELGLYDMSGNVKEWCADLFSSYRMQSHSYPSLSTGESDRVYRGGSWFAFSSDIRISRRDYSQPKNSGSTVGFRLVLSE